MNIEQGILLFIMLLGFILSYGCREEIILKSSDNQPHLVVEGHITNELKQHELYSV